MMRAGGGGGGGGGGGRGGDQRVSYVHLKMKVCNFVHTPVVDLTSGRIESMPSQWNIPVEHSTDPIPPDLWV